MGKLRESRKSTLTLGIDTTSRSSYVSLLRDGVVLRSTVEEEQGSAEVLTDLIRSTMSEGGLSLRALSSIAVCLGPGSFTGIRTGLASAYGLALALQIPVVGISALIARLKPYIGRSKYFVPYEPMSRAENCFSIVCLEEGENSSWKVDVLVPLTFSSFENFETDVHRAILGIGREPSECLKQRVDPSTEIRPAECVAWAAEYFSLSEPEKQIRAFGNPLAPIYGKAANAKTLVQRGVNSH